MSSSSSSSRRSWNDSFALLLSFKEQHGHLNVPRNHQKLGNWFQNQKYALKRKQEGKEHTCSYRISDEHIRQLDNIGFPWLDDYKPTIAHTVATSSSDDENGLSLETTTTSTTTTDTTPAPPKKLPRRHHGRKKIAAKTIRSTGNMDSSSQNKNCLVEDEAPTRKKRHHADIITAPTIDMQQCQQQRQPTLFLETTMKASSSESTNTPFEHVVGHETAKAQSTAILRSLLGPSWTPSNGAIVTEDDNDDVGTAAAAAAAAAATDAADDDPPTTSILLSGPKGCGKVRREKIVIS